MSTAVLWWGVFGLGLTCIARGLWPPRITFAEAMAGYRAARDLPRITAPAWTEDTAATGAGLQERTIARIASVLRRSMPSTVRQLVPVSSHADLTVAGTTPERHLAEKVLTALVAGLTAGVLSAGIVVVADVPLVAPLWLVVVLGVVGFIAPDHTLRHRVRVRRDEMQDVIAAFAYVVALSLSAGNGAQTALRHGVERGDGWAWRQLRAALHAARRTRETEWQALARLGHELDVTELEVLAARARLAENDGARIHDSLQSFANTLQSRRLARIEKGFHRNTLKMAAASCVIAFGYALLLGGAALGGITTG
ncbi:MAG TPA: hypothetical protein VN193_02885 [Candidatus Angelobacter sp.]|nr:hypothetical protein [Candidatus Angelobacter sp.]